MDDRAAIYSIPIWFSLIASLAIIGYNLRRRGQPGTLPLIVLAGFTSVWSLFFGLELLISDQTARQLFEQFQIVSGSLGASVLWFVLDYTQPDRKLRQKTILWLFILPVLTFLLGQANSIHHLLFKNSSNNNLGPFSVLGYTPGVLIWVDVVVGGVFYLLALNILAAHIWRMPGVYRKQALWVVGALLFPAPLALIFLVVFSAKFLGDFVVVGFAVSAVLLNWSVRRSDLSTLMPFAHDLLYQEINQIVIILDREQRVVEINPAGQHALSVSTNQAAGRPIEALMPGLAVLCALNTEPGSQIELNGHTYLAPDP